MKRILIFGLFLSLTMSFNTLCAKDFSVTKTAPGEMVLKEFMKGYGDAENATWFAYTDGSDNEFLLVDFMHKGDHKLRYYQNNHYLCQLTVVPLEYCPHKIKSNVEVLHSDFKLTEAYVVQSGYNPFYYVRMTKGKKKKIEYSAMAFSITGDEMNMDDREPLKEIIEELYFPTNSESK